MNWSPGDKALCIRRALWWQDSGDLATDGPVNGSIYHVELVLHQNDFVWLHLTGFEGWWDSVEFRKIVPESERKESEEIVEGKA